MRLILMVILEELVRISGTKRYIIQKVQKHLLDIHHPHQMWQVVFYNLILVVLIPTD